MRESAPRADALTEILDVLHRRLADLLQGLLCEEGLVCRDDDVVVRQKVGQDLIAEDVVAAVVWRRGKSPRSVRTRGIPGGAA